MPDSPADCWDTLIAMINDLRPQVARLGIVGHTLPTGALETRELFMVKSNIQSILDHYHAAVRQLPPAAGGKGDVA